MRAHVLGKSRAAEQRGDGKANPNNRPAAAVRDDKTGACPTCGRRFSPGFVDRDDCEWAVFLCPGCGAERPGWG